VAIPDKSTQGHVFATSPPPLRLCHNVIARERSDRSNLQLIEKQEIATLPSVARNDKKRIMTQPQGKRGLEGCYENYFRDNRKILLKACP